MTKVRPAGRTLTDPPPFCGGNPKHPESGHVSRPAAWTERPRSARAFRGFSFYSPALRLIAATVLVIGLAVAAAIYFTAEEEPQLSSSYVIVIDPALTKTYTRDLERFGGKAAVLFDDFNRWFAARWHGRALGVTVAWISVGAAAVIYWLGTRSTGK